ncbi:MAG: EF-P lysine aminoacylase GenX, partial [Deltaproteobacteria bacterium]|nr:EF-P lysine aminoacylase GenX [Deltaproteobacteria bacterium]
MLSPEGLQQRSRLLQVVRSFFLSRSYLEVDTPIRLPVLIPEAEIIPIESEDWFLQTSPELCMKRLLARGSSQLFQICHCFRRGERGRLHQQEFTMLEWYHTGWNYLELMDECEEMVRAV